MPARLPSLLRSRRLALALLLVAACGTAPQSAVRRASVAVPARGAMPWLPLAAETFARAKAEGKLIVLDRSAEWCHWCHVMEAETYGDPRVRALLEKHFLAVKVDVDSRPDLEERYGDYGWPATVVLSPDGQELGKLRGYIEADRFLEILHGVLAARPEAEAARATVRTAPRPGDRLTLELLDWAANAVAVELEDYWDPQQGGWGVRQKAPIGANNLWLLSRAARGDEVARRRALYTLEQQAALIDPVWGGIYQYSEGSTWRTPHFEKLMTYQAPALESYARAYRLTREPVQLARARAMFDYLQRFLLRERGTFAGSQDADLHAHEPSKPFLRGAEYYAKPERERLALGVPRIDPHQYGEDNGLAIAAYVAYFEATGDERALAVAKRAAAILLAEHGDPRGGITHEPRKADAATPELRFLADNAALGLALVRLYEATREAKWRDAAAGLARFVLAELVDEPSGALFANTLDPAAVGVLAARRIPFEANVRALRFLLRLRAAQPELAGELTAPIERLARYVMAPENYKTSGRFLGELLLALDELRAGYGTSGSVTVAPSPAPNGKVSAGRPATRALLSGV